MILHLIFRLSIWFLLTSDFSPANIMIGVAIAFILPKTKISVNSIHEWFKILPKILMTLPQAYIEAIEIILFPHRRESLTLEKGSTKRSSILIFLDIFIITFTPKTIVLKYQEEGWYEVHKINR